MSLLIRNAKLIVGRKPVIRQILIENGKISKIGVRIDAKAERLDAKGNFVIPGAIDPHVHFREPGLSHKEDWKSASYAAAAGGITTVLDMPNVIPPTTTIQRLDQKKKLAEKSIVNYGFHFGAAKDNLIEIMKAKKITASTKLFMNISTGELMIENPCAIEKIFTASKLVTVHAEDGKVLEAIGYARKTGTKLYLCHLSLAREIEYLKKSSGNMIYAEATPHHLFLTDKDAKMLGAFGEMKPVLKSEKDQKALWDAISNRLIDTIGTDHAPHTIEEKTSKNPPSGVTGTETMLPLMLDAFNKGRISLTKIVELTSKNAAKIFAIRNKGAITEGYDADLCILDLKLKKRVSNDDLHTKCKWSPFDGRMLKGWPVCTIVNGNIVCRNGDIIPKMAKEVLYEL